MTSKCSQVHNWVVQQALKPFPGKTGLRSDWSAYTLGTQGTLDTLTTLNTLGTQGTLGTLGTQTKATLGKPHAKSYFKFIN